MGKNDALLSALDENFGGSAMTIDKAKLKALAEDAIGKEPGSPSQFLAWQNMSKMANPAAVLELIAQIERQAIQFKEWQASHHANYCAVAEERDQLKAENAGLKTGSEAYERVNAELKAENARSTVREILQLAEIETLRKALRDVSAHVDGNIRETVRDCVNGRDDVQDIYGYCDEIDALIDAALAMGEQS